MRYEAYQKMHHASEGTSDLIQQDQPTENIKTEDEAMDHIDEGASDFTPATENVKMEDDALNAYHDLSFDEDIKLEPEILLTQQEPFFPVPDFRFASALLKQQRRKKGQEKPEFYFCTECDYKAGCKRSLKRHTQSVHLGIVYPCQQCDYVGKFAFQLKKHVLMVHEMKGHPCTQCDFVGEKRGILLKHVDAEHGGRGIYVFLLYYVFF